MNIWFKIDSSDRFAVYLLNWYKLALNIRQPKRTTLILLSNICNAWCEHRSSSWLGSSFNILFLNLLASLCNKEIHTSQWSEACKICLISLDKYKKRVIWSPRNEVNHAKEIFNFKNSIKQVACTPLCEVNQTVS